MKDERVFATKHMNKPKDSKGDLVIVEDIPGKIYKGALIKIKKITNFRKLLYIFLIPLLFIDWVVTIAANIAELICNSIKTLALSLETFINNDRKPPEQET